ncbi:MAG TPA: hypothetical protein PLW02_05300, partial [Verrucomicrobiota bacterium]|nr:hypothetical protein [Verrucomicrobiota bacterium]
TKQAHKPCFSDAGAPACGQGCTTNTLFAHLFSSGPLLSKDFRKQTPSQTMHSTCRINKQMPTKKNVGFLFSGLSAEVFIF